MEVLYVANTSILEQTLRNQEQRGAGIDNRLNGNLHNNQSLCLQQTFSARLRNLWIGMPFEYKRRLLFMQGITKELRQLQSALQQWRKSRRQEIKDHVYVPAPFVVISHHYTIPKQENGTVFVSYRNSRYLNAMLSNETRSESQQRVYLLVCLNNEEGLCFITTKMQPTLFLIALLTFSVLFSLSILILGMPCHPWSDYLLCVFGAGCDWQDRWYGMKGVCDMQMFPFPPILFNPELLPL